jgi:hypothetical protein
MKLYEWVELSTCRWTEFGRNTHRPWRPRGSASSALLAHDSSLSSSNAEALYIKAVHQILSCVWYVLQFADHLDYGISFNRIRSPSPTGASNPRTNSSNNAGLISRAESAFSSFFLLSQIRFHNTSRKRSASPLPSVYRTRILSSRHCRFRACRQGCHQ